MKTTNFIFYWKNPDLGERNFVYIKAQDMIEAQRIFQKRHKKILLDKRIAVTILPARRIR